MRWSSSVGLAKSSELATRYLKNTTSLYGLEWCVVGASVLCWLVDLCRKETCRFYRYEAVQAASPGILAN
jgi:hypothetical protein